MIRNPFKFKISYEGSKIDTIHAKDEKEAEKKLKQFLSKWK